MWDQRYNTDEYVYGKEPNDFLRENIEYFKEGRVLSLAEGEGRNAVFLAQSGAEVTAVDSSPVGLRKAEKLAEAKGVSINPVVADLAEYIPEKEKYTAIISIFCHLQQEIRRRLHGLCIDALVPGGIFLLEGFTPDQIGRGTGGPRIAGMMHNGEELRATFSKFEILHEEERVRVLKEGAHHEGEAAVIRFIARK